MLKVLKFSNFSIGDRVIYINRALKGTVISKDLGYLLVVEFDEPITLGHNCEGAGKLGHCRYLAHHYVEKINNEPSFNKQISNMLDEIYN